MPASTDDIVPLKAKLEAVVRGKYGQSHPAAFVDDVVAAAFLALLELEEPARARIQNLEAYAVRTALNIASDLSKKEVLPDDPDRAGVDADKVRADAYFSRSTAEEAPEYSGVGRPRERRFSDPKVLADHLRRKCNDIVRQELVLRPSESERVVLKDATGV